MLNVYFGGTLTGQIKNGKYTVLQTYNAISEKAKQFFMPFLGESDRFYLCHNQTIQKLGEGLEAVHFEPGGSDCLPGVKRIKSIVHCSKWCYGTQFHPEVHERGEDLSEKKQKYFKRFVNMTFLSSLRALFIRQLTLSYVELRDEILLDSVSKKKDFFNGPLNLSL